MKPMFRPGRDCCLVPYSAEHSAAFCDWYYDFDYRFFFRDFSTALGPDDFKSLGDMLQRSGTTLLTIIDRESGQPIGAMSHILDKRTAKIYKFGIMLDKTCQRKTIAIDAIIVLGDHLFIQKGAHKLTVEFCDLDQQIHRITSKGGFTHDATFKEEIFVDDKYYDEARYSISRTVYDQLYGNYLDGVAAIGEKKPA